MKNIKFGHSLSFYIHIKMISSVKIKKILGISKAIRGFESPLLCIWQFEISVHIFMGPSLGLPSDLFVQIKLTNVTGAIAIFPLASVEPSF